MPAVGVFVGYDYWRWLRECILEQLGVDLVQLVQPPDPKHQMKPQNGKRKTSWQIMERVATFMAKPCP